MAPRVLVARRAHATARGRDHEPDGETQGEEQPDEGDASEDHRRADDPRRGHERGGDQRAEEPTGRAQFVDRAVEAGATVGEVEDPDVGDEEEQRADGDADGRAFRGPGVGVGIRILGVDGAAGPQQEHPEGEAGDGNGDPGPSQDRAGAIGEGSADRSGEIGPEPEGEDRPGDEQGDGEDVGSVPGQLAAGGMPSPGEHPRLGRGGATPGRRALGPRLRGRGRAPGRLGAGRRAATPPRLGRGHAPNANTANTNHSSISGSTAGAQCRRAGRAAVRPPSPRG